MNLVTMLIRIGIVNVLHLQIAVHRVTAGRVGQNQYTPCPEISF